MSEVTLAAVVVEHFRVRGYSVFQEVNLGNRCDIVARLHRLAYAVEVKQQANLAVLAQAARHIGHAHALYVAAPRKPASSWDDFVDVASRLGIGVLRIQHGDSPWGEEKADAPLCCIEFVEPKITRWLDPKREAWLRATLTQDHVALGGVAGAEASQAAWTQFKQFQREVWQTLRRQGPLTVAQIAAALRKDEWRVSAYRWPTDSAARRALHGYFSKGLIPNVERIPTYPAKWEAVGKEFKAA